MQRVENHSADSVVLSVGAGSLGGYPDSEPFPALLNTLWSVPSQSITLLSRFYAFHIIIDFHNVIWGYI